MGGGGRSRVLRHGGSVVGSASHPVQSHARAYLLDVVGAVLEAAAVDGGEGGGGAGGLSECVVVAGAACQVEQAVLARLGELLGELSQLGQGVHWGLVGGGCGGGR